MTDLDAQLTRARTLVERRLSEALEAGPLVPSKLRDAMRYGTLSGGKRVRALLAMESGRICGVPEAAALDAAAAVELIHGYSLVHDDLPAMDDDDLRRGKPTCHKVYGEAAGILVGDGLQALAFGVIAGIRDVSAQRVLVLCAALAEAAGAAGMVGGQSRDIEAERHPDPAHMGLSQVALIQSQKTGALFSWAAGAGPVLSGQDPAPLKTYADALGRAFQIRDDLLDVEGDEDAMGKAARKDAAAGKATYVSLLGVEQARAEGQRLVETALEAIAPYGAEGGTLAHLARFVLERRH